MGDLCTTCMCTGRSLYSIGETGFYHLYSQILNEIQVYDSSPFYIRVCWECLAHLRKWLKFKEQAKRSYTQLQYAQQNNFQQPPEPSPLAVSQAYSYSYPEDDEPHCPLDSDNDRLHAVMMVETHYEPETFVNNLNLEPKKKKGKKVEKPKKKTSKKKIKLKRKIKKERSPSPDSLPDDHLDADDADIEDDDIRDKIIDLSEKREEEKEVPFLRVSTRLCVSTRRRRELKRDSGDVKPAKQAPPREVLPEKPHCAECGKNFSSRKTYRYHLNVLHKGQNRYPCPLCGKVYQWKSNLGRHLRSHKARDSGELYCETCDKRFASVATYRQHLRVSRRHVSESEFSFMCNECGKKFVNKTRLRDHIDWEHLKKIKFRCQLCNKPFKCHTSLYVHLQNVHRNKEKRDNLCHVCGKSFQNAAKLKYHIVAMHTSETPYQCPQCTAAFGWYSSLYRHVREVHYKMKLQPKKSKKSKKSDILPSLVPIQVVLPPLHQPGPP